MPDRLSVTAATGGLLDRLLHEPEVQAVHIEEPGAGKPVTVGVLRRSTLQMRWSYGADLAHALRLALASLHPPPPPEVADG